MAKGKKTSKSARQNPAPKNGCPPELRRVIEQLQRYARMDNARGHELAQACAEALGEATS